MWTFQEFYLPAKRPVCVCGRSAFDAKALLLVPAHIAACAQGMLYAPDIFDGVLERLKIPILRATVALIEDQAAKYNSSGFLKPILACRAESPGTLSRYFSAARGRNSTKEHDKIYALFGFVPTRRMLDSPNYLRPMDELLVEIAVHFIKSAGISVLAQFELSQAQGLLS